MRIKFLRILLALTFPLALGLLHAEDLDPTKTAKGWAFQERDGSFTFFDGSNKSLITWMKDAGAINMLDTSKLGVSPAFWVMDAYNNSWTILGTNLRLIDKSGNPKDPKTLPLEVGDALSDPGGFLLVFRSQDLYLEKRDFKKGEPIWTFGEKPKLTQQVPAPLHRAVIGGDGTVYATEPGSLNLLVLDKASGKQTGKIVVSDASGNLASFKASTESGRQPIRYWQGKNVVFASVACQESGLKDAALGAQALARIELPSGKLSWIPTGLTPDHSLIGLMETEAVFIAPRGGLVYVPIK